MLKILQKVFGDENTRAVKRLWPLVEKVNEWEPKIQPLSDEELKAKTEEFKARLTPSDNSAGESLDDLLPEAFAVVREAARRSLGERHFDVQLVGGVVMHQGNIAEMRTGEGKTLVATLPAYLNALSGQGVHIATVNDYLARRDAVWMGQIYHALGLSVGAISTEGSYRYDPEHPEVDSERDEVGGFKVVDDFLTTVTRPEAYAADIVYGTDSEFGFDYLRDNMEQDPARLRQRQFGFVIIDEIDSILIDEARTPLIISSPSASSEHLYQTFASIAAQLTPEEDYQVDEKMRAITLTDSGISKAEKILGVDNIYTDRGVKYVHHLETAVRAKALFQRDQEYVVRDGEVVVVDQFTGRLQPGRRWSEGLHQALEAKEGIEPRQESQTAASITYQNYFRMYPKIAGMTGTAQTSAEEFLRVYGVETISIPTNQPVRRLDQNDYILQTERGKLQAIARRVKERHQRGQPVLLGTVSIDKNELLSEYLTSQGVPHQMLNAKNHEREGQIIAQAGRQGAVTVATNMAGRGVDIKLGGNPAPPEQAEAVRQLGGLYVIGTERHEARRIDDQLRGRTGRQGDPGETQFFVSLEDRLMRIFASDRIKSMMGRFGIAEDEHIENRMITRAIENAQKKIEGLNFDARKRILEFDDVMDHQRRTIYGQRRRILLGDLSEVKEYLDGLLAQADEETRQAVEDKLEQLGEEIFLANAKRVILQTIDTLWIEHLQVMDHTRSSVNLRAYGQRDPLTEYKREGLRLFRELQISIEQEILRLLTYLEGEPVAVSSFSNTTEKHQSPGQYQALSGSVQPAAAAKPAVNQQHFGRNDRVVLIKDGEEMAIKYKKAEPYLAQGWSIQGREADHQQTSGSGQ